LNTKPLAVRTLEFFAGIGGLKAACPWLDVQASLDIDRDAMYVYTGNFAGAYICCELGSVRANQLDHYQADLWWMSPPCTPFTQKGKRNDKADLRTRALEHLIQLASKLSPRYLVIENVPGFEISQCYLELLRALQQADYETRICRRCPSQVGWPNRRQRIYLLAWKRPVPQQVEEQIIKTWSEEPRNETMPPPLPRKLSEFLDPSITRKQYPKLWLDELTYQQYQLSIDRVHAEDAQAMTACFGASYGKAINRSGSYLWQDDGYRRFSPREVANLLGFSKEFILPDSLSDRRLWHLLGNSLSLPTVRKLMQFTLVNE
jgi:site-specific DNA-cytosine methylase